VGDMFQPDEFAFQFLMVLFFFFTVIVMLNVLIGNIQTSIFLCPECALNLARTMIYIPTPD
jgi:hypothetical protein